MLHYIPACTITLIIISCTWYSLSN